VRNEIIVLAALASLTGCMSTNLGTVGFDSHGRPVPIPGVGVGGDVIGDISLRIDGHGRANIDVKTPPGLKSFPVIRQAVLDKKGTMILGYNEIPMMTGIYHSSTNTSIWSGISRFARSLSNLAGTAFAGLIGIGAVQNGAATTLTPPLN
jgi:hypothetical protein